MDIDAGIRRRRFESWRLVAGSTYAKWIVDNERAMARTAGLIFAIGTPLAVAALFAVLLSPAESPIVLWLWPVLPVGLGVFWLLLSRRRNRLPRKIADDLWTRGFPVVGLPNVYQEKGFLLWMAINRAVPEELEAAAQAPVVQDPPQRTAGPLPLALRLSLGLGLLGILVLTACMLIQLASSGTALLAESRGDGQTSYVGDLGRMILGVLVALWAALEWVNVYLAATGNHVARLVATWQVPIFAIGVPAMVFLIPALAWLEVLGGGAWLASVALLWSPSSTRFITATNSVHRAIRDAVAERTRQSSR